MKSRKINLAFFILFVLSTIVLFSVSQDAVSYLAPLAALILACLHFSLRKAPDKTEMMLAFNVFSLFTIFLPIQLLKESMINEQHLDDIFFPSGTDVALGLLFLFGAALAIAFGLMALKRLNVNVLK